MNPVTVPGYINYFRTIAVVDPDLNHDPQSENNDSEPGAKRFTRWSSDEAVMGLRNKIGWPGLLLEMYQVTTKADVPYDVKGFYTGAFTILQHATPGDVESETEAFEYAEQIYTNVLKQIYQDHYGVNKNRCSTPFTDFYFNNLDIIPVGPLFENEFGWRVEFQFKPKYLAKLSEAPDYGTIEVVEPPSNYLLEDGYITVPAGRLVERIYMEPLAGGNPIAGTAEGLDDLLKELDEPLPAGGNRTGSFDLVCKDPTRIYFSNIIGKTKIAIYTRRLP